MEIRVSDISYIETDEMTDDDLIRETCRYQALAATSIWSVLMDEFRKRQRCKSKLD